MSDVNNFDIIIEALSILNDDPNIEMNGITVEDLFDRLQNKKKFSYKEFKELFDQMEHRDRIINKVDGKLRLAIQRSSIGPEFLSGLKAIQDPQSDKNK